jgi:hypothetical protein
VDPGCSDWARTAHGASYRVCKGSNVFAWQVVTVGASTDERFHVGGYDGCGHAYYLNWNDFSQPQLDQPQLDQAQLDQAHWQAPCTVSYGYIFPTQSSTPNDGPELYTP